MRFDFCSAIDNARFVAEREAAMRRRTQTAVATPPGPGRWCTLPAGGRTVTRNRAAVPATKMKPAGGGNLVHAH